MWKILLIGTVTVSLLSFLFLWQWHNPAVILETVSPAGKYRVAVTGERALPRVWRGENILRFSLDGGDSPLLADGVLAQSDWYDSSASANVAEVFWEEETVLRFTKSARRSGPVDYVTVINTSKKALRYFKIDAGDILLIVDIGPNSEASFTVPRQTWQSWVTGQGRFEDGEVVPFTGVDFFHKDKITHSITFCFRIGDGNLDLASPDLEGRSFAQSFIPRSPCILR